MSHEKSSPKNYVHKKYHEQILRLAKQVIEGIEIEPDPNGGVQMCIQASDDGWYRLRLGEINLTETLNCWLADRKNALAKINAALEIKN